MFSGIIEALGTIKSTEILDQAVRVWVTRPKHFDDVKAGDSIALNGVCLTLEPGFTSELLIFTLGAETLKVLKLGSSAEVLTKHPVNLERSLRFGDRMHGHMVSGHVDGLAQIVESKAVGDSWWIRLKTSSLDSRYLWKKGSVTLNGVSLTVNHVEKATEETFLEVTLIPETIERTNLTGYQVGEVVNLEWDWMAKGLFHMLQERTHV